MAFTQDEVTAAQAQANAQLTVLNGEIQPLADAVGTAQAAFNEAKDTLNAAQAALDSKNAEIGVQETILAVLADEQVEISASTPPPFTPPQATGLQVVRTTGQIAVSTDAPPSGTTGCSFDGWYAETSGPGNAPDFSSEEPDPTSPILITQDDAGNPVDDTRPVVFEAQWLGDSPGPWSDPVSALGIPVSGWIPNIAAGVGSITLGWTGIGGVSFNVYRSLSNSGPFDPIATGAIGESYVDSDPTLVVGTIYYYVVGAVQADGTEIQSSQAASTPGP